MAINKVTTNGLENGIKIQLENSTNEISPALSFEGDTDTGIFSDESGVISFASNGVEVLKISGSGLLNSDGTPYIGDSQNLTSDYIALYVNKSSNNASDALNNNGTSVTTPFITIERALFEVAKQSYRSGVNNDKTENYTIFIYPGEYVIDNRPGLKTATNITNITFPTELYKFNPTTGGVIIPRGTSLIGLDLRKTIIRPKYVPNPAIVPTGIILDSAYMIESNRSYIQEQVFLYITQNNPTFTNINNICKRDIGYFIDAIVKDLKNGGNYYCYTYAEKYISGLNQIQYLTTNELNITLSAIDKVRDIAIAALNNWSGTFGTYNEITTGKTINRTTFTVGNGFDSVGDCTTGNSAVTVLAALMNGILSNPSTYYQLYIKTYGIDVPSPIFKLTGGCFIKNLTFKDAKTTPYNYVTYSGDVPSFTTAINSNYSHHRLVCFAAIEHKNNIGELSIYYNKIDGYDTLLDSGGTREVRTSEYQYVGNINQPDLVGSTSPYIFECSVLSNYGLNGLDLNGDSVDDNSFKSIVVKEFTNIAQQVDDNAYQTDLTDPLEGKKYRWDSFAFKIHNNAYAQLVSCFAIAQSKQFIAQNGGEISLTNSCSDFGGISLFSDGVSKNVLEQNKGYYLLKVLPPSIIENNIQYYNTAYLDPDNITSTFISFNNFLNVNPIDYIYNSYIYVVITNPVTNNNLELQSKIVSSGVIKTNSGINVINGVAVNDENSIYKYLNLIGDYRFETTWYDSNNPPVGGLTAAENTEKDRRKTLLLNANVYVKRIIDNRLDDDKHYSLIISANNSIAEPNINYVIDQINANITSPQNKYYIADIRQLTNNELNNDTNYTSLGKIYKVTLLRGNKNVDGYPDILEDVKLTTDYIDLTSNLDPRLYQPNDLINVSYDQNSVEYLTLSRLFSDFGYSSYQSMLLPTANSINLISRFNNISNLSIVENISSGVAIKFNLLRPSLIRCSGHTWEWVGYRNYSTALPKLQVNLLQFSDKLKAIQTSLNGGTIYATGMDEVGNLYQGNTLVNLGSNNQQTIRYDGLQQPIVSSNVTRFSNLDVDNTLNAVNARINNFIVEDLIFEPTSTLKVSSNGTLSNLTDNNIPTGIIATSSNYGLSRKANPTELLNRNGTGFLIASDLEDYVTVNDVINSLIPVGIILPFAGNVIPPTYLLCDGSYISRTTYADLFAVIGVLYGSTNSSNFRLPPSQGRYLLGSNGTYGLGTTNGSSQFTIDNTNLPSHTHRLLGSNDSSNSATQGLSATPGSGGANGGQGLVVYANNFGAGNSYSQQNSDNVNYVESSQGNNSAPISLLYSSVAINYIIKYTFN